METPLAPSSDPATNALYEQLGSNFDHIPAKFTFSHLREDLRSITHPDNLCHLPVFTPEVRKQIFSELSADIRTGKHFAIVEADSDQLKSANQQISRHFGDLTIIASAAQHTQTLETLEITDQPMVFRSTEGGDELHIIFRNINESDKPKIISYVKSMNSQTRKVHPHLSKREFILSSSTGVAFSDEPGFANEFTLTSDKLSKGEIPHAFNFIEDVKDRANDRAGSTKVLHELEQLPVDQLLSMNPQEFTDFESDRFGGLRVSKGGRKILNMINQTITYRWFRAQLSPDSSLPAIPTASPLSDDTFISTQDKPTLRQIVDQWKQIFITKSSPN
jgi:GGDEF domain-containing protein